MLMCARTVLSSIGISPVTNSNCVTQSFRFGQKRKEVFIKISMCLKTFVFRHEHFFWFMNIVMNTDSKLNVNNSCFLLIIGEIYVSASGVFGLK